MFLHDPLYGYVMTGLDCISWPSACRVIGRVEWDLVRFRDGHCTRLRRPSSPAVLLPLRNCHAAICRARQRRKKRGEIGGALWGHLYVTPAKSYIFLPPSLLFFAPSLVAKSIPLACKSDLFLEHPHLSGRHIRFHTLRGALYFARKGRTVGGREDSVACALGKGEIKSPSFQKA